MTIDKFAMAGAMIAPHMRRTEAEEVLDDGDDKHFFLLDAHRARDGADRPAQRVQVLPRELCARAYEMGM